MGMDAVPHLDGGLGTVEPLEKPRLPVALLLRLSLDEQEALPRRGNHDRGPLDLSDYEAV